MANPAVAAYEAAFRLVQMPSAFVATSALPYPAPYVFHLTGMDEAVSWPLGATQAAQIAALYPDKIIAEAHIEFDEAYLDDHDAVLDIVDRV
ncbi:hypothetical protein SDRG_17438, partial [Saprolegnia diclina VS20]